MKLNSAPFRWIARSVVLVAAIVVSACSVDTAVSPTRTGPMYDGGRADTGNALSLVAPEIGLRQIDRAVDLTGCDSLAAPEGSVLTSEFFARGVQIYRWSGSTWVFVAPSAKLYANEQSRGVVATHYAGPTWETNSGNKVVGAVDKKCTRDQDNIPWLLLRVTSVEGSGLFHRATFIQRVNTVGGVAPSQAGTVVGQEVEVPYTANYLFYRSK